MLVGIPPERWHTLLFLIRTCGALAAVRGSGRTLRVRGGESNDASHHCKSTEGSARQQFQGPSCATQVDPLRHGCSGKPSQRV